MNKTSKTNVVVSAVMAITLCGSLIAGSTYALFTSESKVNIAVTSGKVDVVASLENLTVYSPTKINSNTGVITDSTNAANVENKTFANGGTAVVDGDTLTLTNVTPGDKATVTVSVSNNSNVTVQYRTILACESDNGLFAALTATITKGENSEVYNGETKVSEWTTIEAGEGDFTFDVAVELPTTAGNDHQGETCKLSYTVEAVQGNAETSDPVEGTILIGSATDLANLANKAITEGWGSGTDVTIEVINDIDMTGVNYTTPKQTNKSNLQVNILTVIGNGHSIKGLNNPLLNMYGSIVNISNLTIKDSTMVKMTNNLGYGAFIEGAEWCNVTMTNCHANNVNLTAGDTRAAALVGYLVGKATITNCSVVNSSITAQGSVAGIIGHAIDNTTGSWVGQTIENCTVSGCTFNSTDDGGWRVGAIVGTIDGNQSMAINNCTYTGNTLSQIGKTAPGHDLYGRIVNNGKLIIDGGEFIADGVVLKNGEYLISNANGLVYCATNFNTSDKTINKVFKLTSDIDMSGIEWTPWCNEEQYFNGLFDGQNHTISNLTIADNHTAYDGHAVGFIGRLGANALGENTIQNVTFDKANVSGHHYVGVAVGYNEFGTVNNVKVTNSKVTATHVEGADSCGDKAGALIGMCGPNASYISVTNCSATNCEVKAARHAAQLIGYGYANTTYSNLSATNVTVSAIENSGCDHRDAGVVSANALVGNGTVDGLSLN